MSKVIKSSEFVRGSDSESDDEEYKYTPPKHFHKLSGTAKFPKFEDNKELWLIKVPKGFPVSELKVLPVSFTANSISNGPSTFKIEHNNKKKSYQAIEDLVAADSNSRKYSVFAKQDDKFRDLGKKSEISRFYNIRETLKIPEIDLDVVVTPREDVKKIRQLRMRHFPSGYTADDYTEADAKNVSDIEDVEDASATKIDEDLKVVKKAKTDKKEKKEKKHKKDKKDKSKSG